MEALIIPCLLVVGTLLSLQAAANVQLSAALGSPFGAATLQLGIGAAALLGLAAAAGALGAFALIPEAEPLDLVGGVGSAVYITAGILLFPRLGAVVSVGLFVAGQMGASILIDGLGALGVEQHGPDAPAALGALAVIAGIWLVVRGQASPGSPDLSGHERTGWIGLGLLAGAVLPMQGAINAQLREELDAAVSVGAVSFIVATLAMAGALLVSLSGRDSRLPRAEGLRGAPWWAWLGGLCGAGYVVSVFVSIPEVGVASTVALTIAGQQVASLLVDRHGLFRLTRRPIPPRRLTGVALLLAGVVLIQLT